MNVSRFVSSFVFATLLIISSGVSIAQSLHKELSIGGKVGWMLGADGGLFGGVEASFIWHNGPISPITGITCDFDVCKHAGDKLYRIHTGFETAYATGGIDIGPTFMWDQKHSDIGLMAITYTGLILYPFFAFTLCTSGNFFGEIGTYFKLPSVWESSKEDYSFAAAHPMRLPSSR